MRHIYSLRSGAAASAACSSRVPAASWLLTLLLALLLTACSGPERAVNEAPPAPDAKTPAAELSGPGPSGITIASVLQGVLWRDSDGDGVFGLGDAVLARTPVVLELEGGETVTVETDEVGQYRFAGLEPGTPFTLRHRLTLEQAAMAGQASQLSAPGSRSTSDQIVKHHVWQ